MKYIYAEDLQARMEEIVTKLGMEHVDLKRVKCFRSHGSSTKRTIARCHTIGKLMQKTIGCEAHYAIEFLERFERMSAGDQDKVIIHELLHIPKTFGGGFRQHDYVCEEVVEKLHKQLSGDKVNLQEKRFLPSFFR
ncbi:MAG: putative metallopeptidase [Nanoarchaeota archaeon]